MFPKFKVLNLPSVLYVIYTIINCGCEVGTVDKISDCQPGGSRFNPWPGQGLNFGRPSFATPSMYRDVNLLV